MKAKKILFILFIVNLSFYISCDSSEADEQGSEWRCGTYNGHDLWTGPRGGCYYYNSNDNKTYVDRDFCNC